MRKTILAALVLCSVAGTYQAQASTIITCDNRFGCSSARTSLDGVAGKRAGSHHFKGDARPARISRHRVDSNGNPVGMVRSGKTGAMARVASRYQSIFQRYVDAVEAAGGRISFMGGIRPGRCSIPASKHPCGMAIDLCQTSRGITDPKCHLPTRAALVSIAKRFGLTEGGAWCNSDYGHAEITTPRQARACGHNLYAAVATFKREAAP